MKVVTGLILVFLLGAMFTSLFYMSVGMGMTGGMADCPFMTHEETVCPMDLADHVGAWKSAFLAAVPNVVREALAAAEAVAVLWVVPYLVVSGYWPVPILKRQLRERTYAFSKRPLQELFSSGILHTKLFV